VVVLGHGLLHARANVFFSVNQYCTFGEIRPGRHMNERKDSMLILSVKEFDNLS
jgi:hypothetical protein